MLVIGDDVLAGLNFDRATICMVNSDFHNALIYLDAALELKPNDAPAHWNKAMCFLSLGRYPEGFAEFENRWDFCDWPWQLKKPNPNRIKPWRDGEIAGKRLLLINDGGHGDAIMMLRFVPRVQAMGARITVLLYPAVRRLARQFDVEILTEIPDLAAFDLVCPMFSLMAALGETVETIPNAPYLQAKPKSMGRRIGICWSGVSQTSLDLEKFLQHLQIESTELQALQPGPTHSGVQALPDGDFADLAEIVMGLDHIVTIDTALANLAGALGHSSTHVLVRTVMEWRWYRPDIWYPKIRLYRQKIANDWREPFAQLRQVIS